jgi:hypothetical protein
MVKGDISHGSQSTQNDVFHGSKATILMVIKATSYWKMSPKPMDGRDEQIAQYNPRQPSRLAERDQFSWWQSIHVFHGTKRHFPWLLERSGARP